MDASEIRAERLNAKEVLTPTNDEKIIFPIVDGTVKLCGGDQALRTSTFIWDRPDRGEEQGNLRGESEGSSATPVRESSLYDGETKNALWSTSGNFIYRHHGEHRVKLYVPREASFPFPLKYIDVTRATSTSLDVMLKKKIDDYWSVEIENCQISGQVSLGSRYWIKKHRMDIPGQGERLTRKQTTSRPFVVRNLEREAKMSYRKKPNLDNARKLRGIYCIDPGDEK